MVGGEALLPCFPCVVVVDVMKADFGFEWDDGVYVTVVCTKDRTERTITPTLVIEQFVPLLSHHSSPIPIFPPFFRFIRLCLPNHSKPNHFENRRVRRSPRGSGGSWHQNAMQIAGV
jgi:hypothetical protein